MSLGSMVDNWSEPIVVSIAGQKDKYNQCTYTDTTIQGRLIKTEEEITVKQDKLSGEKVIAKAKLFTTTRLSIDSKVGGYEIISEKICKNKNSTTMFYKYHLG